MNKRLWDERTRGGAPHKPFLILAICDLFGSGVHSTALIPGSGPVLITLAEHFASYWNRFIRDRRGDVMLPFWALGNAGFWTMVPRPGVTATGEAPKGFAAFDKHYMGAELAVAVHSILRDPMDREALRSWVISTYFDQQTVADVIALVRYNCEADSFRQLLLEASKAPKAQEVINQYSTEQNLSRPVRDQGFRIAVREAYGYRCAACGIRVTTPDAHVLVQGAHIRAWSDNADDRIVNGLALCHTCHWGFDEGLWMVNVALTIRTSPVLHWGNNIAGYLGTLDERQLTRPTSTELQPDPESLRWHREEVFRSSL